VNARTKGVRFEREIAEAFEQAGWTVRGLEAGGDHFAVNRDGVLLHVECKRQERMKLPEWLRQQERDCPPGVRRALVFKQSRTPAYAVVPLEEYLNGS